MEKLTILIVLGFLSGCTLPQIRPRAEVQRTFATVDYLEVSAVGQVLTITDRETIARIQMAYSRSKFEPIPQTEPLDMVTICGIQGGQEKFKLRFGAGWIMDIDPESESIVRWGKLTDEDREWLQKNIRSKLPPNPGII